MSEYIIHYSKESLSPTGPSSNKESNTMIKHLLRRRQAALLF